MRNYEDLKVWEKAHQLCLRVYEITEDFPKEEKFGLISQLRRASSSVSINIAEGCGYEIPAEFCRFLKIALGSISETAYIIRLSKDLKFITDDLYQELDADAQIVKRMLYKLRISQSK